MELLTAKIIALTLLGALSLFFGLLPLRIRKYLSQGSRKRERITSCLLCFGGGVLLATIFVHMLPETREGFDRAFYMGYLTAGADYPLAELVICVGFFLIYILEEFVHKMTRVTGADGRNSSSHHHHHHHHHHQNHHHRDYHHHHHQGHNHSVHRLEPMETEGQPKRKSGRCSVYSITEAVKKASAGSPPEAFTIKNKWAETGVDNPGFAGDADATAANNDSIVTTSQVVPANNNESDLVSANTKVEAITNGAMTEQGDPQPMGNGHSHAEGGHSHIEITKLFSKGIASNLRSVLIVLALSIHSVFEGLAVGLQERMTDVWYLFGAIAAHKFVIAFCLGVKLLMSMSVGMMVIYMVVFALVSPLGIAIGILVTESVAGDPGFHTVLVTILQGLAGGTILYVTFFEILERERAKDGGRIWKIFFVCLGFAAMASIEAIGGHSHGPPGEDGGHGHGHSHIGHDHAFDVGHDHGSHSGHDHHSSLGLEVDHFITTPPSSELEAGVDSISEPKTTLEPLDDILGEVHPDSNIELNHGSSLRDSNNPSGFGGSPDYDDLAPAPDGDLKSFHSHEDHHDHSHHGHDHHSHGHDHHPHDH